MQRRLSRILAVIELAVLLIPALGRALFSVVLIWLDPWNLGVFPVELLSVLFAAIAAMTALGRLLGALVFRGPAAFQAVHRLWWWLASIGAAMIVGAPLARLGADTGMAMIESAMMDFVVYLSIVGYAGLYLLVPFVHMFIECRLQARHGGPFEPTSKGQFIRQRLV